MVERPKEIPANSIAIVGMAGRFPGAASVAEFWANQLAGIESITQFSVDELEVQDKAALSALPNYVRARPVLDDVDLFDAEFFGILPSDAAQMDPQQRLFLETCYQALEDAACDPSTHPGSIGVIAGTSYSSYFLSLLRGRDAFVQDYLSNYQIGNYAAMLGTQSDFLATRVAYKLNLRGPSFTLGAGCSTSLLAVCQACRSLLSGESDAMLAGGVSITFPQRRGYFYQDGGMGSPDGHCRPFDADAQGTVFGAGVGVVVLKRLHDAVANGDRIHAVIRGFATNNDGAAKVGYTAPSVEGQAAVIAAAHRVAGIDPSTIGYIEAHGTATPLGDPIELAALTKAFRTQTDRSGFCTIGTAKANVGHLDIAAGITGLIHATQAVRDGRLPKTLHFKAPTSKFDFANSPFRVNTETVDWTSESSPAGVRRAGVSAFGVGGTNAHVVLEEPPAVVSEPAARAAQLLVLSARTPEALDAATENLAAHLEANPEIPLADAAFTLQVGRRRFDRRRAVVAETIPQAVAALRAALGLQAPEGKRRAKAAKVAFLFPGQGSQHVEMGRDLYRTEPVFRAEIDRCADLLQADLATDLRSVFFRDDAPDDPGADTAQTALAQPAIFALEYALATLWMSWGIVPSAMIGHSVGEFVAACLAGVFRLEDALHLVAVRGRLMQALPAGAMLSVRMSEADVLPLLGEGLSIAASNAPALCVVSGSTAAVAVLEEELTRRGAVHRRLRTSHAFHSAMMDPMLAAFQREVEKVPRAMPTIRYISCVSGDWAAADAALGATYWTRHVRETVRFSQGIAKLLEEKDLVLLEVGPGTALSTLARQHAGAATNRSGAAASSASTLASLPYEAAGAQPEGSLVQQALGGLWVAGAVADWSALHVGAARRRTSLPTYPFERKRFWFTEEAETKDTEDELLVISTGTPAAVDPEMAPTLRNPVSDTEERAITSMTASTPARPRQDYLAELTAAIFEDLSGLTISAADRDTSFLELGFDSLFLTQVSQALQSKFGIKMTFRQLLGDQSSLTALCAYLDNHLAPGSFEEAAPAAAVPLLSAAHAVQATQVSALSGGAPRSAVEQLMQTQLQAMHQLFAQQLAALQGAGAPPALTATAVAPPAPAASMVAPPAPPAKDSAGVELKGYTPFKPMQTSVSGELTPRQVDHIRKLTEQYTSRTATSKKKTQQYRKVLADPRVVTGFKLQWKEMIYPIVTDRSKGSHLWDLDGNEYVDILNGFGPIMLGHRPDYVEQAIARQLQEGFETGPQTLLAGEVAEALCEMTGNERATFCNTGSEAVMAAMRVARTVTGRNRVVYFAGDYHGMFDEVLVKGFKRAGQPQSMPIAPGIPRESVANMTVLEYAAPESLEWIRAHAHELAAVMVEPVQSRHPNLQPIEFLRELRKITDEAEVCLIFDEVVTGFRVHPGGCQALFGIRADLATYGKVLAGGMPMGVLAGKARYMDALDGGMWQYGDDSSPEVGVTFFAGTFVRHPLAMAACAAVLKYLKEQGPGLQQRLTERTAGLIARLNGLLRANEVPTHIETFASFFFFSFPSDFRFSSLFYYHLRAKGIHLLEGFPCFLTTEHSDADLDRVYRAFEETIAEMQAGDLLPMPSSAGLSLAASAEQEQALPSVPTSPTSAPITESQIEVLLAAELSDEANCSFNESFTLMLDGALDERRLREALTQLLNRHAALRATFDLANQTQYFTPAGPLHLPVTELATTADGDQAQELAAIVKRDARQPFDLRNGPMVRMQLVRLAPERHALLFTAHHAVCDGWSINVLLDEMAKLYAAGPAAELSPLLPFGEYARAQQAYFQAAQGAEAESYWVQKFAALPPPLELPLDRPRPAMKTYEGSTYYHRIDGDLLKEIKRTGAKNKCTLFATLLAGFGALLGRLTGQDDLAIGVPSAGQSLVEDRTLVGHCVNFVPMRLFPTEGLTTAQFLDQVRKTVFDAYDHQNYTLGRLVRKLSIQRDASRMPLVEVQFNLEKIGEAMDFAGLAARVVPNPKSFVNFDIFLNVVESTNGLALQVDYNTTLIDEATIARWIGCYEELLRSLAADASTPLARLSILNERERDLVSVACNRTHAEYPRSLCVPQLFEAQVERTPQAIALVFEGRQLTYAELNERANRLARYLVRVGVQAGDPVGVYMDRGVDLIVSLLATWKAGAAYIPLDPTFPAERLRMVFDEVADPLLLTHSSVAAQLPVAGPRVLVVDGLESAVAAESADDLTMPYDPAAVAYIIYTSGSTGRPKGVEVTQGNVVNLLLSMQQSPGLSAADVLVAVTTISFDIAALEIYLPLITGAKLVLASRAVASDGKELQRLLSESRATVLQATPITFRLLLAAGWKNDPSVTAWCGGEALPRDLANELLDCGVSLWNMYGPTETTIWSAVNVVTRAEGRVPVGAPIHNTQFYVLDAAQQLVPLGVAGDLYIGGYGVARGYYKQPAMTAARFVPDMFSTDASARLYCTGDRVRRLANGEFEFLGRADGQIKLRGFRIELGEIESALASHPGLREAVVTLREDVPGDRRLVAYVVPSNGSVPAGGDLRDHLSSRLPDYMVPSAYVPLSEFPLTANGKIDRRALPAPDLDALPRSSQYVEASTEEQTTFARIWQEVLHLPRVGVEDNIFELGADSLHVFQIAARANQAGLNVTARQILQYRTIVAILAERALSGRPQQLAPITPVSRAKYRVNVSKPAEATALAAVDERGNR